MGVVGVFEHAVDWIERWIVRGDHDNDGKSNRERKQKGLMLMKQEMIIYYTDHKFTCRHCVRQGK